LLILSIFRIFIKLYIKYYRIIKTKLSIIVKQFVEQQQDRKKRKKVNKFKKILNIKKLRKYKKLLTLILREKSRLYNIQS